MFHPVATIISFQNGLVEHALQSVFPINMLWRPQSLAEITSFCSFHGKQLLKLSDKNIKRIPFYRPINSTYESGSIFKKILWVKAWQEWKRIKKFQRSFLPYKTFFRCNICRGVQWFHFHLSVLHTLVKKKQYENFTHRHFRSFWTIWRPFSIRLTWNFT